MRNIIRETEKCPTCDRTTYAQEEEIYCDICGQRIVDEVGPLDISVSTHEMLANKYDALDSPDICGFDCLAEYLEGVTQFEYFSITLFDDEKITVLAEKLKRKG